MGRWSPLGSFWKDVVSNHGNNQVLSFLNCPPGFLTWLWFPHGFTVFGKCCCRDSRPRSHVTHFLTIFPKPVVRTLLPFLSYSGPHFTEPHAGVDHLVLFASPDFSRVDTPKSAHVFISRGPGLLLVCRLKERFTPWFAQRQAYCGWPLESELSVSEEELEMK